MRAGLDHVRHQHPHQQRQCGKRQEISKRFACHAADFFHIGHAGNTGHHGQENHGGDNHFDNFNERIAQRFHGFAGVREKVSQQNAHHNGKNHLHIQNLIKLLFFNRLCGIEFRWIDI